MDVDPSTKPDKTKQTYLTRHWLNIYNWGFACRLCYSNFLVEMAYIIKQNNFTKIFIKKFSSSSTFLAAKNKLNPFLKQIKRSLCNFSFSPESSAFTIFVKENLVSSIIKCWIYPLFIFYLPSTCIREEHTIKNQWHITGG